MTIVEGRKTAKVDGGYDGGKYIKKVNNLAIPCYSWWRGKDLNLRPSGYESDELPSVSYYISKLVVFVRRIKAYNIKKGA